MRNWLWTILCCGCLRTESDERQAENERQPDESSHLIPDHVVQSYENSPSYIDQQRLQERLGTIVRSKEGKMVNVSSQVPFNLHGNAFPSSEFDSRDRARAHTSGRRRSPSADFHDFHGHGHDDDDHPRDERRYAHYRPHVHPDRPYYHHYPTEPRTHTRHMYEPQPQPQPQPQSHPHPYPYPYPHAYYDDDDPYALNRDRDGHAGGGVGGGAARRSRSRSASRDGLYARARQERPASSRPNPILNVRLVSLDKVASERRARAEKRNHSGGGGDKRSASTEEGGEAVDGGKAPCESPRPMSPNQEFVNRLKAQDANAISLSWGD